MSREGHSAIPKNNSKKLHEGYSVGTDAFQPRVTDVLHFVEVIGEWAATASSIMFFFVAKDGRQ